MSQRPAKHAPNRLDSYLNIHDTIMQQFRDSGFIDADTIVVAPIGSYYRMEGQIACKSRIVVSVLKILENIVDDLVQTVLYEYNVHVFGKGNVFRYDNCHTHEGHADEHHKDVYNFPDETKTCVWVGADRWPTLGEVIEEVRKWHSDHYDLLDAPEEFVPAGDLNCSLRD